MDREINVTVRRKQLFKRSVLVVFLLAGIAGILIFGPAFIKPTLNRNRIRTAKVEYGSLEATITASGTIVPEFEQVLSF